MATKKKRAIPRRPSARRKPAAKRAASRPVLTPSAPLIPEPSSSSSSLLGGLLLVTAIVVLAWLYQHQHGKVPAALAPAAAPSEAAAPTEAVGAPPQARSVATTPPKAGAKRAPSTASAHRATAGDAKAAAPETGAPSLTFDRSQGPLRVRCWRTEAGLASLEVFAPKNRRVRSLKSDAGKVGFVELSWDGKDEAGKKVPEGLYFLRPSQKDAQSIRDVWVQ